MLCHCARAQNRMYNSKQKTFNVANLDQVGSFGVVLRCGRWE